MTQKDRSDSIENEIVNKSYLNEYKQMTDVKLDYNKYMAILQTI